MWIPLCVLCSFSLADFNICSLHLIFDDLINICLGVFCLGFILFGTLGFLNLGGYFLHHFRKNFNYYFLKYFLMSFLFVFFFWDAYDQNVQAFNIPSKVSGASLVAQRLKHLPKMQETWIQSLDQEDPLEKERAIHASILVWRIPWTEEPGRLQYMGSQRVRHSWSDWACMHAGLIMLKSQTRE